MVDVWFVCLACMTLMLRHCCRMLVFILFLFFFSKQKTAYEMRISDWSSDVCSSDLASPASTWTWHVAHEQQPPHSASSSSKPASRIFSITVRLVSPSISCSVPSRVTTISLAMLVPHRFLVAGAMSRVARQIKRCYQQLWEQKENMRWVSASSS